MYTEHKEDWKNPVYEGITEEQKNMILALRSAARSHTDDCRTYLEHNNWNPAAAYSQLNKDGKTQQLSI